MYPTLKMALFCVNIVTTIYDVQCVWLPIPGYAKKSNVLAFRDLSNKVLL